MTQENFNEILFFFYRNEGEHTLAKPDLVGFNDDPIIEELAGMGVLRKRVTSIGQELYSMTTKGKLFMETLPENCTDNPYQYYINTFRVFNSPPADTAGSAYPAKSKYRSKIKIAGWITSIIAVLIVIYEFILKPVFNTPSLF